MMRYKAVVIGVSAGGIMALRDILPQLPAGFAPSVFIVQHIHANHTESLASYFQPFCHIPVRDACDKEPIRPGTIYFAPPNYHLLVENERYLALSVDEKVHFSRPSIDVLFESAAEVYKADLIGVILTGANQDGAAGLHCVRNHGGLAVVQDPQTAVMSTMPEAALQYGGIDYVLPLPEIGELLARMGGRLKKV